MGKIAGDGIAWFVILLALFLFAVLPALQSVLPPPVPPMEAGR